jgi:hypothetical protein
MHVRYNAIFSVVWSSIVLLWGMYSKNRHMCNVSLFMSQKIDLGKVAVQGPIGAYPLFIHSCLRKIIKVR